MSRPRTGAAFAFVPVSCCNYLRLVVKIENALPLSGAARLVQTRVVLYFVIFYHRMDRTSGGRYESSAVVVSSGSCIGTRKASRTPSTNYPLRINLLLFAHRFFGGCAELSVRFKEPPELDGFFVPQDVDHILKHL
jgi:hypothetical protein